MSTEATARGERRLDARQPRGCGEQICKEGGAGERFFVCFFYAFSRFLCSFLKVFFVGFWVDLWSLWRLGWAPEMNSDIWSPYFRSMSQEASRAVSLRPFGQVYSSPTYNVLAQSDGDFALMQLDTPMPITDCIGTACLPKDLNG